MAGSFASKVTLTQDVVEGLKSAKIDITILVDCSHAKNFVTWPQGGADKIIVAKDIELDTSLRFLQGGTPTFARTALKSSPTKSLSKLYEEIEAQTVGAHRGFDTMQYADLKIEFPNFDPKLVDLKHQALSGIVGVCRSADKQAFNNQPETLRSVMGMYTRSVNLTGQASYLAPSPDARPRVA